MGTSMCMHRCTNVGMRVPSPPQLTVDVCVLAVFVFVCLDGDLGCWSIAAENERERERGSAHSREFAVIEGVCFCGLISDRHTSVL